MRRIALFAAGTLFGVTAFSQSLLDCMDQDVVRGLLLQGQSENPIVISAAVPPELASFKAPAQFTWIGSAERGLNFGNGNTGAVTTMSRTSAAYRSTAA